jgi:probable HAF family extracellular repeat protein
MIRYEYVAIRAAIRLAGTPLFQLRWQLLFLFVGLGPFSPLPVCAAVFYPLSNGDDYDIANGVSPDGTVVLTTRNIWTPAGGFVPIAPAHSEVWSRDISNNGIVAGLWCGPNTGSCYEAFRAPAGGPMQGLGAFDNSASDAFAVTPDGSVVVGNASSPTGTQSFRWTEATGLVGLGNLHPNVNSHDLAFGVSANGSVVVGQSGDDTTIEAYRWTAATGMVGLGDLPGGIFTSSARGISSDGQVIVGFAGGTEGIEAFRWSEATGIVGLGELPGGEFTSAAAAASADGAVIVGLSHTNLGTEAFIWDAAHGMRNLREVLISEHGLGTALAGWTLTEALDISDNGNVIVGYGYHSGQSAGFVVIIPEPGMATLALAALFSVIVTRLHTPRENFKSDSLRCR